MSIENCPGGTRYTKNKEKETKKCKDVMGNKTVNIQRSNDCVHICLFSDNNG